MLLLHEWALVLFTLLSQTAIGIVLVGECLISRTENLDIKAQVRRQSCFAFLLFVVGALVSLGHTGSPFNSFHTFLNVASSWLSREIVLLCLTGLAFLWLAYLRFKKTGQSQEKVAGILVIILGLALVAAMSRVYRFPVAPAWDSYSGILAFFGSVLLMGALWQGMALRKIETCSSNDACVQMLLMAFAFIGLILVAVSLPLGVPVTDVGINAATALVPPSCIAASLALRILLTGLGVMLFTLLLFRNARQCVYASFIAFVLVLTGELLGRSMFYLSYARLGM